MAADMSAAGNKPAEPKASTSPPPDWIDRNLRALYDEVATEPLPDEMLSLLKQIDRKRGDKS